MDAAPTPQVQPRTMGRPPRRRRWPIYSVVLLVAVAVLWVGYWYGASTVASAAINRVTAAPVGGLKIGCPNRDISGFPLRLDIRCQRVTVADAKGMNTELGGVSASVPLYWPTTIQAVLDAPIKINAPEQGLALTADWTFASASGSVWLDGLTGGSAHFEGLSLQNGGNTEKIPLKALAARIADAGVAPAGGGDYRISADAQRVNLTLADSPPIPEMDLRTHVVATGVGALGTDPAAALLKWARSGASMKIEDLRLVLGGSIVTASGQLALSKEGLLNGSLLLGYNGIEALGNLLDLIRPGTKAKYAEPLKIVNQLTRAVDTPDGQMRQTSITFTDGRVWLTIIPLPIEPIPAIKF